MVQMPGWCILFSYDMRLSSHKHHTLHCPHPDSVFPTNAVHSGHKTNGFLHLNLHQPRLLARKHAQRIVYPLSSYQEDRHAKIQYLWRQDPKVLLRVSI